MARFRRRQRSAHHRSQMGTCPLGHDAIRLPRCASLSLSARPSARPSDRPKRMQELAAMTDPKLNQECAACNGSSPRKSHFFPPSPQKPPPRNSPASSRTCPRANSERTDGGVLRGTSARPPRRSPAEGGRMSLRRRGQERRWEDRVRVLAPPGRLPRAIEP
ncbi:hypothetical protein BC628DRAFT_1095169 [Trametes gibbosa]|nr:hypothetical protein BC628DRAFT_1095169 [Trametes gibbosa]